MEKRATDSDALMERLQREVEKVKGYYFLVIHIFKRKLTGNIINKLFCIEDELQETMAHYQLLRKETGDGRGYGIRAVN